MNRYGSNAVNKRRRILGKDIVDINCAVNRFSSPVFIIANGENSALGTWEIEYLCGLGYRRNVDVFLIRDYCKLHRTNLIHVLRGKNVVFTGEETLCDRFMSYLKGVENGEINVRYECAGAQAQSDCDGRYEHADIQLQDLCNCEVKDKDEIVCWVRIWHGELYNFSIHQELSGTNIYDNSTEYFASAESLCMAQEYLEGNEHKYREDLKPKGIVVSKIPGCSGNVFIDGAIDGHPDIIRIGALYLMSNLFQYCVMLAGLDSQEVLDRFWTLYRQDTDELRCKEDFVNKDLFEMCARRRLARKEQFTSQELFVIFHIAYHEMCYDGIEIDITSKVIWWEAHWQSKNLADYMFRWLDGNGVDMHTFCMVRDNTVRMGTLCRTNEIIGNDTCNAVTGIVFMNAKIMDNPELPHDSSREIWKRFEDVKLRPKDNLSQICSELGISWSDSLLVSSEMGKNSSFRGISGCDLTPVFKKNEQWLSEYDRLRLYITCGEYQKKYGYPYESILQFSRRTLEEMFVEEFRFCESDSKSEKNKVSMARFNDRLAWGLWNVRKRELIVHEEPRLPHFDYGQPMERCLKGENEYINTDVIEFQRQRTKARHKVIDWVNTHDNIILYGTGRDCEAIVASLDSDKRTKLLYADKKAKNGRYVYNGINVMTPEEAADMSHKGYNILITSSQYYRTIESELRSMGAEPDRIFSNTVQFWED